MRSELARRWGAANANKFIQEAKEFGWLVSPFRGIFYVPPMEDLLVVGSLSDPQRREFLLSRTLAAAGYRFWCLSAWASLRGVELPGPAIVTDLSRGKRDVSQQKAEETGVPSVRAITERNRKIADGLSALPVEESLVLVPYVPRIGGPDVRVPVVVPAAPARVAEYAWLGAGETANAVRTVTIVMSPGVADSAWIAALLQAIGIPRLRGVLPRLLAEDRGQVKGGAKAMLDRVRNRMGLFGPPEPNERWGSVLATGQYPYLLVPPALWKEVIDTSFSMRYQSVSELQEAWDAGS